MIFTPEFFILEVVSRIPFLQFYTQTLENTAASYILHTQHCLNIELQIYIIGENPVHIQEDSHFLLTCFLISRNQQMNCWLRGISLQCLLL